MDDRITIKQLEQSYRRAIDAAKKPYQRVMDFKTPLKEPNYAKPPTVLRGYFGVEDGR